jgi:hypothetical protein
MQLQSVCHDSLPWLIFFSLDGFTHDISAILSLHSSVALSQRRLLAASSRALLLWLSLKFVRTLFSPEASTAGTLLVRYAAAKAATSPTNIEEQVLFDGAPRNSQALTIDAEPGRSERQMFGLTQKYLDYKYEFRNNS